MRKGRESGNGDFLNFPRFFTTGTISTEGVFRQKGGDALNLCLA